MDAPIVFISRFRLREGTSESFRSIFDELVGMIRSSKPRTALYDAYLNDAGTEVGIVHVFPDAPALGRHFEGSDDRTRSIADLMDLIGFQVFGPAPQDAVAQLRREAEAAGGSLELFSQSIGGFLRAPAPSDGD